MATASANGTAEQAAGTRAGALSGEETRATVSHPDAGQLVRQIEHIIKDSSSSPPSPPGTSLTKETASPASESPPAVPASPPQRDSQPQPERPKFSLEDGMSEISISEPSPEPSRGSSATATGRSSRLSAPRQSLQPPTSPFVMDDESLEEDAPLNGSLGKSAFAPEATEAAGSSQHAAASSRDIRPPAPADMDDAEDIDVGAAEKSNNKDSIAPGVAVQMRPFSPPPGTAAPIPSFSPQEPPADFYEPPEFKGLLFYDGVDNLGRPVVVVDFDAVAPSTARSAVMQYILQRLEPIVSQGPYVLVMLTTGKTGTSYLKGAWLIAAYRNLSRPFRKNVKYILLVKPSNGIRALLLLFKPFVSRKAHSKLKKVPALADIAAVTNNEVQLQHLGPRFASAAGQYIADGIKNRPGSGQNALKSFAMPSSGPT